MYGTNDILQNIIRQSVKGYSDWQIEPIWISIENNEKEINRIEILPEIGQVGSQMYREVSKTINLNNDILILTNKELDIPLNATLTLESHGNLFTITKAEFEVITFHKFQTFSRYLKIHLKDYGNYIPFQLKFLRVSPKLISGFSHHHHGFKHGHDRNCNSQHNN